MERKRSRRQLIIEILEILNREKRGLRITRLMFKLGVPLYLLNNYLEELFSLELIEKKPYKKAYKIFITSKGQKVNHHFFITNSKEREFGFIL